jgi:hypothetical protein
MSVGDTPTPKVSRYLSESETLLSGTLALCSNIAFNSMPLEPSCENSVELEKTMNGSGKNSRSGWEALAQQYLRAITLLLHIVLFLFHLALIAAYKFHPEHQLQFEPSRQRFVSTVMTILLQAFSIVRSVSFNTCNLG